MTPKFSKIKRGEIAWPEFVLSLGLDTVVSSAVTLVLGGRRSPAKYCICFGYSFQRIAKTDAPNSRHTITSVYSIKFGR